MDNMQINICFRELASKKHTTAYYEELVFDISRMLKYFTDEEIYFSLEETHSPDTLHFAIDEAKELVKR